MHQFVQSAIEAAKQGDKEKAVDFLRQVLAENPNDVDAWLVFAAVVDDPQTKRKCLNRVLKLDPVNVVAREELAEMDHADMGYSPVEFDRIQGPFVSTQDEFDYFSTPSSAFESVEEPIPPVPGRVESQTPVEGESSAQKPRKLVFGFPMIWRVIVYFLVLLFGCIGLWVAAQNFLFSLPFIGIAVLMLVVALAVSSTVELSGKGIRTSSLLSKKELGWDEMADVKNNSMLFRLELMKSDGETVNISTLVNGYPRIVKILRKQRPDLFNAESQPQA